ncbi:hypothetical protein JC200_14025 [Alicyclobacillus sp. ALC3]|nr:hypothetical protein JC200_14025 [Alicyclobacillus sp. ALC3]
MDLTSEIKGYGRILDIESPSIFVELYRVKRNFNLDINKLLDCTVLLMIWCTDNGFKKNDWKIVGHVPVDGFDMPDFVTKDALTGQLKIVRGNEKIDATDELLKHAQPYGIFGHEAVRIRYLHELNLPV